LVEELAKDVEPDGIKGSFPFVAPNDNKGQKEQQRTHYEPNHIYSPISSNTLPHPYLTSEVVACPHTQDAQQQKEGFHGCKYIYTV
jgi:hypothetical protein